MSVLRKQDCEQDPKSRKRYDRYLRLHRQSKARRRLLRVEEAIHMLGGVCSVCGKTNQTKLQFHHKDPSTKKFGIAIGCHQVSRERFVAEVKKCALLCRSCHDIVSYQERRERLGVCVDADEVSVGDLDELIPPGGSQLGRK